MNSSQLKPNFPTTEKKVKTLTIKKVKKPEKKSEDKITKKKDEIISELSKSPLKQSTKSEKTLDNSSFIVSKISYLESNDSLSTSPDIRGRGRKSEIRDNKPGFGNHSLSRRSDSSTIIEQTFESPDKSSRARSCSKTIKLQAVSHELDKSDTLNDTGFLKSTKYDHAFLDTVEQEEEDENSFEECKVDSDMIKIEGDIDNQKSFLNDKPKKKKGFTALSEMVPLNLEEERIIFFSKGGKYNPKFEYNMDLFKQQFSKPHIKYLKISKMILNACIKEFGDDERFMEITGGRLITQQDTEYHFNKYIKELNLEDQISLVFSDKTVSTTSVVHDPSGTSKVIVSLPINYRSNRIRGVLDHEIGTHFIRKQNDRGQIWYKNRKKYELKPFIVTEEGLASLNQTLNDALSAKGRPYLYNSALHYYSGYMASIVGFEALYRDLEKYIKDPVKRWKECVRVKRGISDTSQPGGMYKDQVYLRGAIEILKNRKKLDFTLLHAGKLHFKDMQKLVKANLIRTDHIKLPLFLNDMEKYREGLDRIAAFNFIDALKVV